MFGSGFSRSFFLLLVRVLVQTFSPFKLANIYGPVFCQVTRNPKIRHRLFTQGTPNINKWWGGGAFLASSLFSTPITKEFHYFLFNPENTYLVWQCLRRFLNSPGSSSPIHFQNLDPCNDIQNRLGFSNQ